MIPKRDKLILIAISVALIWLLIDCTYEPLAPPELPKWYQTINLPLVDASFFLAELQDTANHIFGDSLSDSLYFKFTGALDTATLTEDIFMIPGIGSFEVRQDCHLRPLQVFHDSLSKRARH